jgi:IS30 family transposase
MKKYTQLDHEQRYQISELHKAGWNQTQMADEMGVHKSTISREFSRNKGRRGSRPKQAQSMRDERKQAYVNGKPPRVRIVVALL